MDYKIQQFFGTQYRIKPPYLAKNTNITFSATGGVV